MLVFQMEVRVFAVLPASTGRLHLPPHVLHVLQGNSKDQVGTEEHRAPTATQENLVQLAVSDVVNVQTAEC